MVQAAPGITPKTLRNYFKDAAFGVRGSDIARTYEPRAGLVILRDKGFNVPHIYGTTRADTMFGAGYVSAEDRLFMMDTLRYLGRGRLSEFLGASDSNLASDRAIYRSAGYTEQELQRLIDRLVRLRPRDGATVKKDLDNFSAGVNQYIDEAIADPSKLPAEYAALQQQPKDWQPTDTAAVASLIGSQLGVGGGNELENAAFIGALRKKGYSFKKARRIHADFRFANDPEAPVTTSKRFPWLRRARRSINAKARAMPDNPSAVAAQASIARMPQKIDGPFGPMRIDLPGAMSNALLVGSRLSRDGRPIAVMGPQVAYFSPQILMEMELHGPGIASRGVGFPGISFYTLLGRGDGYAWSATSAGGDLVDIFAERLCEPNGGKPILNSNHYRRSGKCVPLYTRTDQWAAKPTAGGIPDPGAESIVVEMTTQRTDNGIVQARGRIKGVPHAFVQQRSSFKAEVDSAFAYIDIMNPNRIDNAQDFQRAFAKFSFTFNWFFVDGKDIAFQLGGYHPIRAPGVDLDLPNFGTRRWRWRGMLSFKNTPKARSPRRGFITSWNNKQAPGFRASDGQYGYGPVHRVQPLNDGIQRIKRRGRKVRLVDLVNIMGDAGTVDLRGYAVLPHMLRVIGQSPTKRIDRAMDLLRVWHRSGAHRRDRNKDGRYEHSAAVALMDRWWERALKAIFTPALGNAYAALPAPHDNPPGPRGSAYIEGLYGHVQKDLRTLLGRRVRGKFSRPYCGKGKRRACRRALLTSLGAAITTLEREFGKAPSTWRADQDGDRIVFTPVGVVGQRTIQWQNRPTFQQVMKFRR